MRARSIARSPAPSSTSLPSSSRTSPPSSGSIADQPERFLALVESYLARAVEEGQATAAPLGIFEKALGKLIGLAKPFAAYKRDPDPLAGTWEELTSAQATLSAGIEAFADEVAARSADWNEGGIEGSRDNAALHAAREGLHGMADRCRDLTQQIDLAAKLSGRVVDIAVKKLEAGKSDLWANADINKARKALEDARAGAVEALKRARYFVRQADWLQERFPEAELRDVEGLVKLVDRDEIESHDGSLTPGRYVGIAPEEEEEDFDFEAALQSIHIDLKGLNEEAAVLAARIARNFEGLGFVSWPISELGSLIEADGGLLQTGPFGSQLKQAEYTDYGVPVVMPRDIENGQVNTKTVARVPEATADRLSRHKIRAYGIVLPRRGAVSKRAFIRPDQEGWLCGTGCLKIEATGRRIWPKYLYYYMGAMESVDWLEKKRSWVNNAQS